MASVMNTLNRVPINAPASSRRTMSMALAGATLFLLMIRFDSFTPSFVSHKTYAAAPKASFEASEKTTKSESP